MFFFGGCGFLIIDFAHTFKSYFNGIGVIAWLPQCQPSDMKIMRTSVNQMKAQQSCGYFSLYQVSARKTLLQ